MRNGDFTEVLRVRPGPLRSCERPGVIASTILEGGIHAGISISQASPWRAQAEPC